MKSDRFFNATNSLIISGCLITLGILMCLGRDRLYIDFVNLFLLIILCLSIKPFFNYFLDKEKNKNINFTRSFLNLLFCLICSLFKDIPLSILPLIFGLYLLLNSVIKFINYYILFKEKANGKLTEFILGFIYFGVSIPIIFSPLKHLTTVLIIIGVYSILLGINYLFDFISAIIPKKLKNKLKRKIRISLPVFIEAIIPYTVLREINYQLDKDTYDKSFIVENKDSDNDIEIDLEIFVHTSNRGFNRMGHVDIYYDNKVISYGNYDDSSINFFTMLGDGVLFTTSRDKYIPFCIEHSKKTIFAFGLRLTDIQKKKVTQAINKIFDNVYEWQPPYVEALSKNKKVNMNEYKDYASRLYQTNKAKFYKFKTGRFRKYFTLGNNCCRLADHIVGKSGIDLLKITGIITPGTYYEYLNREFQKKNSMVISRKIYNSKNVDKKTVKEIFKGFSK